jgi:hypothetical protein
MRGGKREGAGRKPGVPNKRTQRFMAKIEADLNSVAAPLPALFATPFMWLSPRRRLSLFPLPSILSSTLEATFERMLPASRNARSVTAGPAA